MAVSPVPAGHHTVTPYLIVEDPDGVMKFLIAAFDAQETMCMRTPDGKVAHAEMQIGDSRVMIGGACESFAAMQMMLYLYVDDCDKLYQQAIAAGGESVQEPTDQFYGDRSSAVKDAGGNQWWIATHVEDVPEEEIARRAVELYQSEQGE